MNKDEVLVETSPGQLERILIVENSFRVGIGLLIAKLLRSEKFPILNALVIDMDEVADAIENYVPDVVILDVDSLQYSSALNVSLAIRLIRPEQVIIFASDRINPAFIKEGMVAALWSRAYWLNSPTANPTLVLPEIMRALAGGQLLEREILEAAVTDSHHLGRLTPQQHRVMRLMSVGASNGKIAEECRMTPKAVERMISSASRLLRVEPSSADTNHRVNAANTYRQSMQYIDLSYPEH